MFKSRSIAEHTVRGILGFGLLSVALTYAATLGWWTMLPAAGALLSFRGCPMCWTMGFVETILGRKSQASCSLPSPKNP